MFVPENQLVYIIYEYPNLLLHVIASFARGLPQRSSLQKRIAFARRPRGRLIESTYFRRKSPINGRWIEAY